MLVSCSSLPSVKRVGCLVPAGHSPGHACPRRSVRARGECVEPSRTGDGRSLMWPKENQNSFMATIRHENTQKLFVSSGAFLRPKEAPAVAEALARQACLVPFVAFCKMDRVDGCLGLLSPMWPKENQNSFMATIRHENTQKLFVSSGAFLRPKEGRISFLATRGA